MRVFVSYPRVNRAAVHDLCADITDAGHDVWVDEKLTGGQVWWDEILEQIRRCDVFLAVVSPAALDSQACRLEREYAVAVHRPLLPALVEPVDPALLPADLAAIQVLDYTVRDRASAFGLARALTARRSSPSLPDVLPVPPPPPTSPLADPPVVGAGREQEAPAGTAAAATRRHNLPVQLSSFVGRDAEVAELVDLVPRHRLVTITGFGGTGKTRLALQVAAELCDGDGDGVWFVDLSATDDVARVPSAVAAVLGVPETGAGPATAVVRWVTDKRLLLVLDNLEQITGCASFVSELLTAAPMTRVLATSRTPLHVPGEYEYVLTSLPVADPEAQYADADRLASSPAVRLFVDRATEARHDFALTDANAPAVAAVCARLGGHPLSIELAAARIKVLSPQSLLDRLQSILGVLTGGGDQRPERQRTLRATIAWSYDALPVSSQVLLDGLSVFPGTCTLPAVEAICGALLERDESVLDALTDLVESGLVVTHEPTPDEAERRFSLLVSIREFAAERLSDRHRTDDVRRRHARFFTDTMRLPPDWTGEQGALWSAAARRDLHNLRTALDYWERDGTAAEQAECAAGLVSAVVSLGAYNVAIDVARAALARLGADSPVSVFTCCLHDDLGWALHATGNDRLARVEAGETLRQARLLQRADLVASAAIAATSYATTADEATAYADEAEEAIGRLPPSGNDPPLWLLLFNFRSVLFRVMRYVDPDRARTAAAAASDLGGAVEAGFPYESERMLAGLLMDEGRYDEARALIGPVESMVTSTAGSTSGTGLADLARLSYLCELLGPVYLGLHDVAKARHFAELSSARAKELGYSRYQYMSGLDIAACQFAVGDLDGAARTLRGLLSDMASAADSLWLGRTQWRLARVVRLRGEPEATRPLLDAAWATLAGEQLLMLPDLLGCLVERALAVAAADQPQAAHLVGLVEGYRRRFVLPMGVAEEIPPLLQRLRDDMGDDELDRILSVARSAPLPPPATAACPAGSMGST